jgi:hypothetical protein
VHWLCKASVANVKLIFIKCNGWDKLVADLHITHQTSHECDLNLGHYYVNFFSAWEGAGQRVTMESFRISKNVAQISQWLYIAVISPRPVTHPPSRSDCNP